MTQGISKIIQISAILATLLSGVWFYVTPSYEPAITFLGSLIVLLRGKKIELINNPKTYCSVITENKNDEEICEVGALITAIKLAYISDRPAILKNSIDNVQSITSGELLEILNLLNISDRPKSILIVANKLKKPIKQKDMEKIISAVYISDRKEVASYLLNK